MYISLGPQSRHHARNFFGVVLTFYRSGRFGDQELLLAINFDGKKHFVENIGAISTSSFKI